MEFLHHSFSMYINVLSTASSQDQEVIESHFFFLPLLVTHIVYSRTNAFGNR